MCIVLKGQDGVVEQARRQLEDLVCIPAPLFLATPSYLIGPCMGCLGLYQHPDYRTGTPPRQGFNPRARIRRRAAHRWPFAST